MTMKLSSHSIIISFLLLSSYLIAGCDAVHSLVGATTTTKKPKMQPRLDAALLQIRGGGDGGVLGTPITQKQLAVLFVAYQAIQASVGIPAPEILAKMYSGESIIIQPGSSADEVCWSFMGSGMASVGIMTYLDVFTDTDPAKIALAGAIPCGYVAWKLFLTDSFRKAGMKEGGGLFMVLSFVPALFLAMGKGDEQLIIKYFATICTLSGLTSMLGSTDLMKTLYGVSIDGKLLVGNLYMI